MKDIRILITVTDYIPDKTPIHCREEITIECYDRVIMGKNKLLELIVDKLENRLSCYREQI